MCVWCVLRRCKFRDGMSTWRLGLSALSCCTGAVTLPAARRAQSSVNLLRGAVLPSLCRSHCCNYLWLFFSRSVLGGGDHGPRWVRRFESSSQSCVPTACSPQTAMGRRTHLRYVAVVRVPHWRLSAVLCELPHKFYIPRSAVCKHGCAFSAVPGAHVRQGDVQDRDY